MTRIVLYITLLFITLTTFAQTPQGFKFQAVLRDQQNIPLNDVNAIVKVEIVSGSTSGTIVYAEEHATQTNPSGLINLIIGGGSSSDNFSSIDWANGPYFVKLYVDDELFSASQLLSVPFAMHASSAESVASFGVSSLGDTLNINGEKYVVPGISSKNKSKYPNQVCLGGSKDEKPISVIANNDGSIIVAGIGQSFNGDIQGAHGADDIWIIKLNVDKSIAWQKSIGGSKYETVHSIISNENGGCYFTGTTESTDGDISINNGNFDIVFGELNASGQLNWIKTIGGGNADFINSFHKTADGGFLIGATSFSLGGDVLVNNGDADIWIVKLNALREIQWQKSLGGLRYDALSHLEILTNDELLVVGSTESNDADINGNNGAMDFWVAKLDNSHAVSQQRCIGSVSNDAVNTVTFADNTAFIAGVSFSSDWDAYTSRQTKNLKFVKATIGAFGQAIEKQYGGSYAEEVKQVIKTASGYVVLAESESFDGDVNGNHGDKDLWLLELDASLNISKNICLGGVYSESASVIKPISTGGYIIAAESTSNDGDVSSNSGASDIWVIKVDANFAISKQKVVGGSEDETITDILLNDDASKATLVGTTKSNDYGVEGLHGQAGKNTDIWVITIDI